MHFNDLSHKPIEGDNRNTDVRELEDVEVSGTNPGYGFMLSFSTPHKAPEGFPNNIPGGLLFFTAGSPDREVNLAELNGKVWRNMTRLESLIDILSL